MTRVLGALAFWFAASCSGSAFDKPRETNPFVRVWFTPATDVMGWPGTAAIADGLVILGARQGLAAFRESSGERAWTSQMWTRPVSAFATNIAIGDGRACIADQWTVGCIRVSDGQVLWTFDPDSLSGDGESAYSQGTWFYGSRDHKVHAVDPSNGAERWATDITPEAQYMTRIFGVVVRGDTVIATTVRWVTRGSIPVKGDVVALNKITGKVLWRFTTQGDRGGFQGKALLTNRLAIVNDAYAHSLIGIDLVTGKEVWRTTNDQLGFINSETTPVLVGDTVYAASTDTQVYAVDANTGTILWRVVGDLNSLGSVDACPRFLIPLEFAGGKPFLIDRATHNVASTEAVGAGKIITSRFAVHGDMAYADGSGGVYAFRCN